MLEWKNRINNYIFFNSVGPGGEEEYFFILLRWKRNVKEFTLDMFCCFWEECKQNLALSALRVFTIPPETAVHLMFCEILGWGFWKNKQL